MHLRYKFELRISGAIVTVVTCGSEPEPGESRLDLVRRNARAFAEVIQRVIQPNPDGVILAAANPRRCPGV